MEMFTVDVDPTGIRLKVGEKAITAPCLLDDEVDHAIEHLKADLDRMAGLMKARIRREATPLFPIDDA